MTSRFRRSQSLRFQLPGRTLNLTTISEVSPHGSPANSSRSKSPRSPSNQSGTTAMLAAVIDDLELPGKIKPPPLVMFAPGAQLVLQVRGLLAYTQSRVECLPMLHVLPRAEREP